MSGYACAACGMECDVQGGSLQRPCTCVAPVVVQLTATAYGTGGVSS